jgi:GT2 family glycosyltransferase
MNSYVKSLLATIELCSRNNISVVWSCEYASHVADAREKTLSGTNQNRVDESRPFHGEVTYDKILWIDSDIAWNPEDVLKLYYSDKDIISGAYLLASGEVVVYPKLLRSGMNHQEVKELTEPIQVEGAGFGFICFKQGIFEKMSRPWFQQVMITHIDKETKEKFTFPLMGEDLSLCKRARELGYELWFDPSVKVIHHKMMKLTWDGPMP